MSQLEPIQHYTTDRYQSFYTDAQPIRNLMLNLLGNVDGQRLLEPCAGEGAFLKELIGRPAHIDAVDIDPKHISILRARFQEQTNVIHADFIDLFVTDHASHPVLNHSYNAVICNPPYGLKFSVAYRRQIKQRYPNLYARESYGLFMVFALSRLAADGRYVFIVPDTFLTSRNHRPLRAFLAAHARPTHIIRFESKRFESVNYAYGHMCIIAGRRQPLTSNQRVIWKDVVEGDDLPSLDQLGSNDTIEGTYLLDHLETGWVHPVLNAAITLAEDSLMLGDIAECRTGLYTGDNPRFCAYDRTVTVVRGKGHPIEWDKQVYQAPLTDEQKRVGLEDPSTPYVPLIRGGHQDPFAITRWAVDWHTDTVRFYATDKKARLQNQRFYFRRGLALPMVTSKRLSASLMENAVFDQGVVGVFPHEAAMIDFLLIYLNSEFVATHVKKVINPGANNSANYIKRIPVPHTTPDDLQAASRIVAQARLIGWAHTADQRAAFIIRFLPHGADVEHG